MIVQIRALRVHTREDGRATQNLPSRYPRRTQPNKSYPPTRHPPQMTPPWASTLPRSRRRGGGGENGARQGAANASERAKREASERPLGAHPARAVAPTARRPQSESGLRDHTIAPARRRYARRRTGVLGGDAKSSMPEATRRATSVMPYANEELLPRSLRRKTNNPSVKSTGSPTYTHTPYLSLYLFIPFLSLSF